jgi:hypothetical protein
MHDQDDDIIRVVEDTPTAPSHDGPRWKVAIIDDDPAIHSGTRYYLSDKELGGVRLELFSAI